MDKFDKLHGRLPDDYAITLEYVVSVYGTEIALDEWAQYWGYENFNSLCDNFGVEEE